MADEQTTLPALTPEQIANWRRLLTGRFGAYALIMPVEQIETLRARMQGLSDRQSQQATAGEGATTE